MENIPAGCGSDLGTILEIFKNESNLEKCTQFCQRLDVNPNIAKDICYQPKLRPALVGRNGTTEFENLAGVRD